MFNSKFNALLTGLLIVAIVAIIAIIGYFGYSIYNKYYINANANEAVNHFDEITGGNKVIPSDTDQNGENVTIGDGTFDDSIYDNNNSSSGTTATYYGYNVLGTISIPKINIKYPILEKTSIKALRVAVGYLSGAGINKVGNTVIQGHNNKNGLFFSNLGKLTDGDKIYIKDPTGTQVTYEVYKIFNASDKDTSFYKRDTAGKREITLSTCTDNDENLRIIVLAREL